MQLSGEQRPPTPTRLSRRGIFSAPEGQQVEMLVAILGAITFNNPTTLTNGLKPDLQHLGFRQNILYYTLSALSCPIRHGFTVCVCVCAHSVYTNHMKHSFCSTQGQTPQICAPTGQSGDPPQCVGSLQASVIHNTHAHEPQN